jgi:hypothetical protein
MTFMDNCPEGHAGATSRDEVAREVGIGSGRTYERHTRTMQAAPPDVRAIESTRGPLHPG